MSWSIAVLAFEWTIRVVMLAIVPRRRSPANALAWLTVIFLIPPVGLVLYVVLGRYRLPQRRARRYADAHVLFRRSLDYRPLDVRTRAYLWYAGLRRNSVMDRSSTVLAAAEEVSA